MNIDEYIKLKNINGEIFADLVGVSAGNVSKYRARKVRPGDEVMRRIYEITGGLVTPNDFYDLPPADAPAMQGAEVAV